MPEPLSNPSAITADGIAQLALAQQRLTNSACSHPHFFSPLTASAGTFPRSSYLKLDALLLIRCPLLQTCECKGRAIGKCFKTAERAHFHVAITSRIREGREEISILGWGNLCSCLPGSKGGGCPGGLSGSTTQRELLGVRKCAAANQKTADQRRQPGRRKDHGDSHKLIDGCVDWTRTGLGPTTTNLPVEMVDFKDSRRWREALLLRCVPTARFS